ncbi:hypothetical protein Tco_1359314 [Tanacetum coccineum]
MYGSNQIADILTKHLPVYQHKYLCEKLRIYDQFSNQIKGEFMNVEVTVRICPFCLNDDGGVENGREVFVAMDSYQLFINGKDLLGTGGFLDIILGLILAACFSFGSPELFFHPRDPGEFRFGGVDGGISNVGSGSGGCGGGRKREERSVVNNSYVEEYDYSSLALD